MRTSIRGLSAATALASIFFVAAPAFADDSVGDSEESSVSSFAEIPSEDNDDETAEAVVTTSEPSDVVRAVEPVEEAESNKLAGVSGLTVSGSATLITDYRFRGVSQTDKDGAIQGGFTIAHDSGVYVGTWASNLAGYGTFGGANIELDIFAGVEIPVGEGLLDVGVTYFSYPGGADTTDFFEGFAKLSGDIGPLSLTGSVFYAPSQEALGNVFATGADAVLGIPTDPGDKEDNLYLAADASYGLGDAAGLPVTLNAHIGYSDGNPGLGPNGTSIAPTGTYFDWSFGAEVEVLTGLTFGVSYIDTDISQADSAFLQPNFSEGLDGTGSIADGTIVASLTASF